ncbi:uncharacterized protein LOC105690800 isoform X1 [Athalia rosae]|uniref:uncharacterized protein LOC105690800 isoform X1 n=1 Tax=Athalia rosae TaxID=37344 RepID=UPI002033E11B|nr:uncharacterized protein LOC105690800 isoform X1 [Athalia rosae]
MASISEDTTKENFYDTYDGKFREQDILHNEKGPDIHLNDPSVEIGESTSRSVKKTSREMRKHLKNTGQEFVNAAGKLVPAKVFVNKCCGCQQGCAKVISAARREKLFNTYYEIPWEEKTTFIKQHVQLKHVNRRYSKKEESRRTYSRVYRLSDENGSLKIVCKKFFLDTIAVSCKRVNGALHRNIVFGEIEPDKRGRQKKVKIEDEQFAYQFISNLPTYELDGLKYLTNEVSVTGMHKSYKEICSQFQRLPVSIFYFRKLFSTKFELYFRPQNK